MWTAQAAGTECASWLRAASRSLGVQSWDGLDWKWSVDRLEVSQIAAVGVETIRQALEAHQTAQARDPYRSTAELDGFCSLRHSLEVQRREPTAKDVDDAVPTIYAQTARIRNLGARQDLPVTQAPTVHLLDEAHDRCIGLAAICHQQIAVLGCTNVAVGNYGKTPDHHMLQTYSVGVRDDAD